MEKDKHITNKTFVLTAVLGSLLIMAMVIANTLWSTKQIASATDEAVSAVSTFYLEEMADRRAKIITNMINGTFESLERALDYIDREKVKTQEELRETIGRINSLLTLKRFALADRDNIVYTQYTTYTGASRHAFLSAEKLQDRIISDVSFYGSSRQLCLVVPARDLSVMGKSVKACFVQLDIDDIVDLLAFEDQSRTFFGLYSGSGVNLSGTELGPVISDRNILEAAKDVVSEDVWKKTCEDFENGEEGSMRLSSGGAEEDLCYVPVKGTGWEIAVLTRDSVIKDQIRDISDKNLETSRNQMIFSLVCVLLLGVVLLAQLSKLSKRKLEKEKETSRSFRNIANKDSLTGVRNRHAYYENEASINQQIQENSLQKLAVVVCDINGLKYVNDNIGHSAGDQLIKDACSLICEYFNHGAVFRVGGDEFAVLLQGTGYDTMMETVDRFNRKAEANIREGRVVVSIGYSVLEPGDQYLHDVFERADQMMYERKKELKEMGAHSR